jgi:hypothetical protein
LRMMILRRRLGSVGSLLMGGSKALVVFVNVVYSMSLLEEVFPVLHTCTWEYAGVLLA